MSNWWSIGTGRKRKGAKPRPGMKAGKKRPHTITIRERMCEHVCKRLLKEFNNPHNVLPAQISKIHAKTRSHGISGHTLNFFNTNDT